jgi:hypothetical protein
MGLFAWLFGEKVADARPSGTFVMDAEWERAEELRPDRLGPGEDDLDDEEPVVNLYSLNDPERPVRTLGPIPKQ